MVCDPVSGFTKRHADGRLLRLALRHLSEADGTDDGGAAVSRRCWRPHRLLPAQAFSPSPGTGRELVRKNFLDNNQVSGKVPIKI